MRVNLQAHTEHHSGYGRFGVEMARALGALGVENVGDIGLVPADFHPDLTTPTGDPAALARVALWLSTPPHVRGWYEGQFAVIFTMWESTEIPPGFRQNLHHFDRIIVPSLQNQELFSRFHPDVRRVPLGIGAEWGYVPAPPVEREFRFLTAGFGPRKGSTDVARAFLRVFPKGQPLTRLGPIPRLIVRSHDDVGGPGITRIPQRLSRAEELTLYTGSHCFVSGSKGEGWGFMPMQAIAKGRPTILGNAHGHAAFAHYGIGLDTHPYRCDKATFWGDGGEWWEPDFDQMCEAMRDVYEQYDAYADAARYASIAMTAEFSWENAAKALILELSDELFGAAPTERVWRGAPPRLFHIRVNKAVQYVINGRTHYFEPGKDYYDSAELKRCILANGHLDLAAFDPNDLGMEDGAVADELRARNGICPTCNQPFNRDQTLRELVGALDE